MQIKREKKSIKIEGCTRLDGGGKRKRQGQF